jgi:hypothetical protein
MIVCLYGKSAEPFVAPALADLQAAAVRRGGEIAALAIETAVRAEREWQSVQRLYVLPFDVPLHLPAALPPLAPQLLPALFPRAELVNAPAAHELCWDKLTMARRLLERGVPMPESLITSDPDEARDFVRQHAQAILKEPRSCGGHGHVVLFADDRGTIAGEVPGRRYAVDFTASGVGRSLAHGVLSCPPPFYLQRLVTGVGRAGVLKPAQILRAYVVDGQVLFWTERYRARLRRPADFIINATFGATYRFQPGVSDAAHTVARRAAEVLGVRVGVVDLIRAGDDGPYVLEVDTDGYHMMIDRSFKLLPEYRDVYDLDRYIADLLLAPATPTPRVPRMRRERPQPRGRRPARGRS